jgi:hypothetical protein
MSRTELYKVVKRHGGVDIVLAAEFENSFHGAMFVWNTMARIFKGWSAFPMIDEERQQMVWDLWKNKLDVGFIDRLVLASTFDWAVVKKENFEMLAHAFKEFHRKYATQEYGSNLWRQADRILELMQDSSVLAVCWNQTSVNDPCWYEWSEELGEDLVYNFDEGDDHWDVFESLESLLEE